MRVHLIGIGGSGLSAIARILLERGETVSGSDRQLSPLAVELAEAGVRIMVGHHADNIAGVDMVVRSSAIPIDNPEVQAALNAGVSVLKRSEFLPQLLAGFQVIAVAGTHGKTTTTAMIAWVLETLGEDISYIIGGIPLNLGANAHAGKSTRFVIEADEYDYMFLGLNPQVAVVTNVEYDHPDCFPTPDDFYQAFQQFVDGIVPDGTLITYIDDAGARRLHQTALERGKRSLTYGFQGDDQLNLDYYAQHLFLNEFGAYSFDMICDSLKRGTNSRALPVRLQVPGRHNVANALATMAVVDVLGLPLTKAAQALAEYRGTGRRFEVRGEIGGIVVVDDYAHHPTEIRATLEAARARYPEREIYTVWQPHTYSRTRRLLDEFVISFNDADHVLITEIYPAREPVPSDGFSARQIIKVMPHPDVHFIPDVNQAVDQLIAMLAPKAVVLVLSAGDANQISTDLLRYLDNPDETEEVTN